MIKKIIISLIILIVVGGSGLTYYVLSHLSLEDLIICSTQPEKIPGPNAVCEYYTVHFRGTKQDVDELEQGAGLALVFNVKKYKYQMMNFLLKKGVDINKISPISGFTPLESAVLMNDTKLVSYLLDHGADPSIKSGNAPLKIFTQRTPLEIAEILQKNKSHPNRSEVIQILKEHNVESKKP